MSNYIEIAKKDVNKEVLGYIAQVTDLKYLVKSRDIGGKEHVIVKIKMGEGAYFIKKGYTLLTNAEVKKLNQDELAKLKLAHPEYFIFIN